MHQGPLELVALCVVDGLAWVRLHALSGPSQLMAGCPLARVGVQGVVGVIVEHPEVVHDRPPHRGR
eukprot:9167256-Lingulodinium_polyedra.AAC.1